MRAFFSEGQGSGAKGVVAEVMDLGAACRTYNVLRAEGRQIAAVLIPAGPPPDKKLSD